MPELPEVETIRRGLQKKIINKKIVNIEVIKPKLIRNKMDYFLNTLKNNYIFDIDRVGKLLIFNLAKDDLYLLVHLKMTGQLIYVLGDSYLAGGHNFPQVDNLPNKYSHIIIRFSDNSHLFFNDLRQFGYWQIVDKNQRQKIENKYGLEPGKENFKWSEFKKIFNKRKGVLKAILLNQQIISGIGNIYADEICFRAKILPDRTVDTLTESEIKILYQACQYIINKAIVNRGTTFSDYRDSDNQKGNFVRFLKVYGRAGKKCLRCKKEDIKKIKLAGRGTHYCPNCQK
ncbi:bifunctional DNA-formamidopyrimidine glycosylase/DNA-(apurinic or apyrimidinic site) lyase [Patescibacteria group bacterium]|nr:bifunctional DNA-formamidopyrimidine glycosylase/DNA-(apurinic or apyrimidinic site) lyase [Patescibacteria group bacterium]